jgi:putative hemin transport protein
MPLDTVEPNLAERWKELRAAEPNIRIFDAAAKLGTGEMSLLRIDPSARVRRIRSDWRAAFDGIATLGRTMALTRNRSCVHERKGTYARAKIDGDSGMVLGEDIDLRLFLSGWKHAFAVEPQDDKRRPSLQFFDASGGAVHKVHLLAESDRAAYDRFVSAALTEEEPAAATARGRGHGGPAADGDKPVDVAAFRAAWQALRDTHDFFKMLRQFGVSRLRAFELAGEDLARPLAGGTVTTLLERASASGVSIMVFVGNKGCIQIHTGPVQNIKPMGPWINVLDPAFNLHLRADLVTSAWLVRKPTDDGVVTSVELFDAEGGTIAMFFGARKPGKPELPAWRMLAEGLPTLEG